MIAGIRTSRIRPAKGGSVAGGAARNVCPQVCSLRAFASTARVPEPPRLPRMYRYFVDIHGQTFLYDTVPKNLTSCLKDVRFLNFFADRIRANTPDLSNTSPPPADPPSNWHEDDSFLSSNEWVSSEQDARNQAAILAHSQGYEWISDCQGEWNFIETAEYGTPIVFRELSRDDGDDEWSLTWGGDRRFALQVDKLRVCPESGYLYHPSPLPYLSKWKRRDGQESTEPTPYGTYSLLSSQLVLGNFAESLEVEPDLFSSGQGGSVQWQGKRHQMGVLQRGSKEE